MKIDDKIRNKKIAYLLEREPAAAFELSLLYFILAKRKTAEDKIIDACKRSFYWLRKAGIKSPSYIKELNGPGLLEEIERILVLVTANVGARFGVA